MSGKSISYPNGVLLSADALDEDDARPFLYVLQETPSRLRGMSSQANRFSFAIDFARNVSLPERKAVVECFMNAYNDPEFQKKLKEYRDRA